MAIVPTPISLTADWRKFLFQIPGSAIDQWSIQRELYEDFVEFRVRGQAARDLINQVYNGTAPAIPEKIVPDPMDQERLSAARQDNAVLRERATLAEEKVVELTQELDEYQGEVAVLSEELERLKNPPPPTRLKHLTSKAFDPGWMKTLIDDPATDFSWRQSASMTFPLQTIDPDALKIISGGLITGT